MNNEYDEQDPTLQDPGEEASMPLGVGDGSTQGGGFVSDDAPSAMKRHAGGALLLVAVVVVAIAGLFSMRTLTRASAAIEAPTEVERSIEQFLSMIETGKSPVAANPGDDGALDVLSESYTQRQVPLDGVQRNPFIIFEPTNIRPAAPEPTLDPIAERRRAMAAKIDRAGERLRLGSVLMGSSPLANINNKVLRVGDTLNVQPEDVTFTVVSISQSSVDLIIEDVELDLSVTITVSIRRD